MNIIAVYNLKGGVGKTAACVNLSYVSAVNGSKTLLCDLDPQGSASYYFKIKPSKKFNKKSFLRGGKNIDKNIKGTDYPGLDLLPADFSFRNLDLALDGFRKSKSKILRLLKPYKKEYDYIILDCPPNITLLAENIFKAADHILMPVIPTTLSELAFEKMMKFFKKNDIPSKKITAFFSMVESRKLLHSELMKKLSGEYNNFIDNYIPYNSLIEKMGIYREPVVKYQPASEPAKAYEKLWKEIEKRLD